MLEDSILKAQMGDSNELMLLIEKFKPLILKYSRKLGYEDAYSDIQLEFIEVILLFDLEKLNIRSEGALVNYISNSVYHAYCKILSKVVKQRHPTVSIEDLTAAQLGSDALTDQFTQCQLPAYPRNLLTDNEDTIIRFIYEQELSAAEIARRMGITRQGVNQCKLRAEKKLKKYYACGTNE